ncbi:hypothetical protein [Streptomyces sp. NPDC005799]|uniref:hypothetical protein n=1 Tax=Streptomyces sp. NPDC005799 TaxID=3154678 RepID=UPI0033C71520
MRFSTSPGHVGTKVWVRVVGDELVVTARQITDLVELVRHHVSTPGAPRILDEHDPHHPGGRSIHKSRPKPRTEAEIAYLAIGPGAEPLLLESGPAGAVRIRAKTARAVELATVVGTDLVDRALDLAAVNGRFNDAPRYVLRGPARGPLASGPGMAVPPLSKA